MSSGAVILLHQEIFHFSPGNDLWVKGQAGTGLAWEQQMQEICDASPPPTPTPPAGSNQTDSQFEVSWRRIDGR